VITEEMLANAAYHDHANNGNDAKFSFIVTTPVSEYSDGVEAWGCPECGYVEYSGPISAYDFFNDTTARKLKVAQAGQTIHIDARQWVSFSKEVIDAMRARQDDITIELVYNSNGQLSTLTIPRGTDFSEVPEDKYTGMDFLALKLNIAPVPKN
nr:hypothetical protein [Lachnospiraceae bacterium]